MSLTLFAVCAFLSFLNETRGDTNTWGKATGSNSQDIWYSTSDFVPVQSESFGTIKIGRIMSMEFDFVFGGRTNDPNKDQSEMFFRIGYDATGGTSCDAQNSRYPSFSLSSESETLYFIGSDGDGCSNVYSLEEYGIITVGITYHILVHFNDTSFFVGISGGNKSLWTNQWDRIPTLESHLGDEVPIWWMSDKFGPSQYNRANGTFSDVIITSNWFWYDTPTPTNEPTISPSTAAPSTTTQNDISSVSPTIPNNQNPTSFAPIPSAKPSRAPSVYPITISSPTMSPTPSPSYQPAPSALSSIAGTYYLIAGATALSLCFLCLGLFAFIWVRCKNMHSQIHDIRRHIHNMNIRKAREQVPNHSQCDVEMIFYSPVAAELDAPERTHTPNNTFISSPVTIPLHSPLWISNVLYHYYYQRINTCTFH